MIGIGVPCAAARCGAAARAVAPRPARKCLRLSVVIGMPVSPQPAGRRGEQDTSGWINCQHSTRIDLDRIQKIGAPRAVNSMHTVKLGLESQDKVLTLERRAAYAAPFKSFRGKSPRVAGMEEDA